MLRDFATADFPVPVRPPYKYCIKDSGVLQWTRTVLLYPKFSNWTNLPVATVVLYYWASI
jgi:hypothetical protein